MHFFRLTPDNRILAGGGPGLVPVRRRAWITTPRRKRMGASGALHRHDVSRARRHPHHPPLGRRLLGHARTRRRRSARCTAGRRVYSVGCTGHGVAMTHQNGRILADLVLGRDTELTRAVVRQPPLAFRCRPSRSAGSAPRPSPPPWRSTTGGAIAGGAAHERAAHMRKSPSSAPPACWAFP